MVLALCAGVRGATVDANVSSRETQVGVPITLRVTINDAEDAPAPVVPDIPDVRVRSRGGPSRSSQTTIINGAMQSRTSLTYDYELTPTKEGRFVIPAIEVKLGNVTGKTTPISVVVSKSETGDLLFVEIKGNRKKLYVGETLGLKLQIWLRPFTDPRYGKLSESNMWSLVDRESTWGGFGETLQQMMSRGEGINGREALRKDSQGQERSYYLYEVERNVQVDRPGPLPPEDINIIVTYPTRLAPSNSLFSSGLRMVSATRISGQAKIEPIEVLPVPTEGRPAFYSGAVGTYQIEATAKPTEVTVGDPITLTLTVKGSGNLDKLQPPPLASIPALTNSFRVPAEPLAGEVTPEGKKFSVSIRATSENVTEIPPIPFAYFNAMTEKYVTVASEAIPLKVKPADKLSMSQIVDASGNRQPVANRLTESASGILANYTGMDEVLAQQAFQPGLAVLVIAVLPPLSFVVSWTIRRRSERLRTDVGFARKRRAKRDAVRRLQGISTDAAGSAAAAITAALGQYVADRCNLPAGGMTRAAVVAQLRARNVTATRVSEVDALLEECEAIHYGGTGVRSAADLQQAAMRCVEALESERI
jgi:hypothetical protein